MLLICLINVPRDYYLDSTLSPSEVNSPGSNTDGAGAGYVHSTDHPVAALRSHKHALDGPLLLQ